MHNSPGSIVRRVLKVLAVAIAASAVGLGVGSGVGKLSGHDDSASPAPVTTTSPPRTATTSTQRSPAQRSHAVRLRVLSAVLLRASTASGRARQRARLSVRVRVTNRGARIPVAQNPRLLVGATQVAPDRQALDLAGTLLKPLAPRASATGELRFETAGPMTRRLAEHRRARLRIAYQIITVTIRSSKTAVPVR